MKHLQHLIILLYIIFSFSGQPNGLILASSQNHPPSSIPTSYLSSAPHSSSSSHFSDRNPDPLSVPTSYISSAPSTSPNDNNASKDLELQLSSASRDAHLAIVISQQILKNPSTTILIRKCLGQCVQNYYTIADDITKATNDLHANDVYMLKEDLNSVEDDLSACQSCFKDMIGGHSPLKAYEDSIDSAASNCLAIISQTKKIN